MMTWLRGARCTDPEAMPEMERGPRPKIATVERREASVPRHGTRRTPPGADPSRLTNATNEIVRLSALRPPLVGVDAKGKARTRAHQRVAGTKKRTLFDIVNRDDGQRFALRAADLSCPGRAQRDTDLGPA